MIYVSKYVYTCNRDSTQEEDVFPEVLTSPRLYNNVQRHSKDSDNASVSIHVEQTLKPINIHP